MYYHCRYRPHKTGFKIAPTRGNVIIVHMLPLRMGVTTSTKELYSAARQSCCEVLGSSVDGYKHCCLLGCDAV